MTFAFYINLFGLWWPYEIIIKLLPNDLVALAISNNPGNKICAIKELRHLWIQETHEDPGLREAKNMIDAAWPVERRY